MDIAGATHVGMVRKNNEDSYKITSAHGQHLLVIADGMGGHRAGEVASSIAVNSIVEQFESKPMKAKAFIEQAIQTAHDRIVASAGEDIRNEGMGTTVEVVVLEDERLTVGHVGDSRVYHYTGGTLTQLTEDHSYVQELVKKGVLTKEEAQNHPRKNVITRVLGSEENAVGDIHTVSWKQGDMLLLCTDGLSNGVTDREIVQILKRRVKAKTKVKALIDLANTKGGRDNITVVVAQY